ncbi:MAG: sigma-70 family RNA polymerase sigma factor [Planctomycetota bacterium]|nr:MAG: sigma-70 family RNA polymerase sigma factor [Planctomycetota bacterium]
MSAPEHESIQRPMDAAIAAALVDSHREFLAFVERRVGNRAAAEDVLQQAFARGLGALGELESAGSARAWFYRVLRNAIVDHRRRGDARARHEAAAALRADAGEPVDDAELERVICACVGRLADTLKPEYATALRRIELDGVPVARFAAEAGISASNAAVRVHRARQSLRKRVEQSCGTCAEHGCVDCHCKPPSPR